MDVVFSLAGNRYWCVFFLLLSVAMNSVPVAAVEADGEIEALSAHSMDLDRNGDFEMARRSFLEVLHALRQRENDDRELEPGSIYRRFGVSRNDYPALDAALDYHQLLVASPAGKWVKLHEQKPTDEVIFVRQRHAGSTFDTQRGRLILFGSNTHGKDWQNSPLFFDPAFGEWSRAYADDPPATYAVDDSGVPVAGANGNHPWAMHTFGSVSYDATRDQLVVASYPGHMEPGRFTKVLSHLWREVGRHPTWIFDLKDNRWSPLPGPAISFFPFATIYDSDRSVVIGYKTDGIFELSGSPRSWRQIAEHGFAGWHNNAVYDSKNRVLVGFGSHYDSRNKTPIGFEPHDTSNDIVIYEPSTGWHAKMPTPGKRPPKTQHTPLAFHPGIGKTVALVAGTPRGASSATSSETWLYDFRSDEWRRAKVGRMPFAIGMNYNLEYDSMRDVLLFVASSDRGTTAVWMLRF